MIKVCHLSTAHKFHDIRILRKECQSLAKKGYDVYFVVPAPNDMIEDGVKIVPIQVTPTKFRRAFLLPILALKKSLSVKADIYHFHDFELWPVALLLRFLGKKVIADVHEDIPAQLLQRPWIPRPIRKPLSLIAKWFEDISARTMSAVVTVDASLVRRFSKVNSDVTMLENFPLLQELPLSNKCDDTFKLVSLGGVLDERCANTIIAASKGLTGVSIVIGGGISKRYSDLSWQTDNCRYLGYLSAQDALNENVNADAIFVMFSDQPNHLEIKSNRLYESMYTGKPVIVSSMSNWQAFIDKNECGFAVDQTNPESLIEAIERLKNDKQLAQRLGKNGKQAVLADYSWPSQENKLFDLYKRVER